MEEVQITIIGAGVVGLAIAAELSSRYEDIIVVEKHESFGCETSSRNSEVIHSGIYYEEGTLKARLCLEGNHRIYDICKTHSIPFKRTGKLIIAIEEKELPQLDKLFARGVRNGIKDLSMLDKRNIAKIEPNTNAIAAIYSSHTGIVDSHELMRYFFTQAKGRGVLFAYNSEAGSIEKVDNGYRIGINDTEYAFQTKIVINCGGLHADKVASLAGIDAVRSGYKIKFCKGTYFYYSKPSPINTLVYPLPEVDLTGLGIHATFDMTGRLRFGPDTEYVEDIDYYVDPGKREVFYKGVSRIIPGLNEEFFIPDQSGIRPKLYAKGEAIRDFVINDETDKGLPGFINLVGIESPGLTASPAIAKFVEAIVDRFI